MANLVTGSKQGVNDCHGRCVGSQRKEKRHSQCRTQKEDTSAVDKGKKGLAICSMKRNIKLVMVESTIVPKLQKVAGRNPW
jgi:hypothetical protein